MNNQIRTQIHNKHKSFELNGWYNLSMKQKLSGWTKRLGAKQKIAILAALALVIVAGVVLTLSKPERSAASYCKVYRAEKARIAKLPGDTYPSLLFDHPLSDAGEFVASLDRLERVAPNDIRPDVHTLKTLYQKLHDDPSQLTSVSFAAEPVDNSVNEWTAAHCPKSSR